MEKLKPCPFCGSEELRTVDTGRFCYVRCDNCFTEGPDVDYENADGSFAFLEADRKAEEAWNTRKRGTCEMERTYWYDDEQIPAIECECGWGMTCDEEIPLPKHCHGCKRKVVSE